MGVNVGYEQDGKGDNFARPVIIFRKFNNEVCWVIPLSAKIKSGKFYLPIDLDDNVPRVAILSQLRLIDAKRLYQKIGVLREDEIEKLRSVIINLCKDSKKK
jgi:mRNA interferase MazF